MVVTALVFVVLTLTALVLMPLLVQRRVEQHRRAIANSEPARTLLMRLQFDLVRQVSTLGQYAVTEDTEWTQMFRAARNEERQTWSRLEPLAKSLGPDVQAQFVEAHTVARVWHQQVHEEQLLRERSSATAALQGRGMREDFEQLLSATERLDAAILERTRIEREKIEDAEQAGMLFTFISGALALLAALVVVGLVLRIRRLADEAERGREQAATALALSARATESRQRLFRGVTHDVKNPLGAALGYAELLGMGVKGSLNDEQEKLVRGVQRSIDSALAIISDLLDLARVDGGGITVERINVKLTDLVREAASDHRAAAEAAGHQVVCDVAPAGCECYTDPTRVRQIIDNLMSNAIKYTPAPGRIAISAEADAADAPFPQRACAIRVSDTGPGIPLEERERVFDEFARLDDHSHTKGHGLGLAIARRIARLLGGELGIVDTGQSGATFVLWLPQRDVEAAETRTGSAAATGQTSSGKRASWMARASRKHALPES